MTEEKTIADTKAVLGIFELEQKYKALEERLQKQSTIVPVQSLAPHQIDVSRPILVVIREDEGIVVASWVDANVNASGETEGEAIEMLKDAIVSNFAVLQDQEHVLGDDLRTRLAVMRQFLRAK